MKTYKIYPKTPANIIRNSVVAITLRVRQHAHSHVCAHSVYVCAYIHTHRRRRVLRREPLTPKVKAVKSDGRFIRWLFDIIDNWSFGLAVNTLWLKIL